MVSEPTTESKRARKNRNVTGFLKWKMAKEAGGGEKRATAHPGKGNKEGGLRKGYLNNKKRGEMQVVTARGGRIGTSIRDGL